MSLGKAVKINRFQAFAPAILKVYRRDREAFWAAVMAPFMSETTSLSPERLGKAYLIEDYWRVFLLFGAVIQMIDDWTDLEGDLAVGHYSYITLGAKDLHDTRQARQVAKPCAANRDASPEPTKGARRCSLKRALYWSD